MPYSPASSSDVLSVCVRSACDDPAVVVLARADDYVDEPGFVPSVLTSALCATCARDAVDDLLRRAVLGVEAPALALSAIDWKA